MAQRGGNDSDKLNPTHVTSSRALGHFDQRTRNDLCGGDDDDKLLDVVGPPQSPLLPLGHSLSQFNSGPHAGKFPKLRHKRFETLWLFHKNNFKINNFPVFALFILSFNSLV